MSAIIEREKIVPFEFKSEMRDIGMWKASLKLLRKTPEVVTNIKLTRARMLGGLRPASNADDLHFDVMATLTNAVEPVPNPYPMDPAAWINDVMDPAIWYAIYDRWQEYQASFTAAPAEGAKVGEGAQASV